MLAEHLGEDSSGSLRLFSPPSSLKGTEKKKYGLVLKKTRLGFASHLDGLRISAYHNSQNSSMTAPLVNGQRGVSQARLIQICLRRESQIIPIFGLELRKRGRLLVSKHFLGH